MQSTPCLLCGAVDNYKILYKANFSEADLSADVFSARRMPDRVHYQVVECVRDGMVRSNPVLPRCDAEQLYRRSKLNYGDEIENLTQTYMAALKPVLDLLPKEAKIVEIGCGNGFMLKALAQRGFEQSLGVEPSADAVMKAEAQIKSRIINDAFKVGLFEAQSIDFIFFFQTLDHLHEPNEFVGECYRLLKPGGYIVSFQHDVRSVSARVLGKRSPIIDIEHIYLFSAATISAFFKKNGFCVQKVYKPANIVSMRHLLWLLPISNAFKEALFKSPRGIIQRLLSLRLRLKLGNLCVVAKKV